MPHRIDLTLMHRFRERAERALPGRLKRVVLFGSRARAQNRPGSDRSRGGPAVSAGEADYLAKAHRMLAQARRRNWVNRPASMAAS